MKISDEEKEYWLWDRVMADMQEVINKAETEAKINRVFAEQAKEMRDKLPKPKNPKVKNVITG